MGALVASSASIAGRATPSTMPRRKPALDRKSTRLNSSHSQISYAVFCLKKKKEVVLAEHHPGAGPKRVGVARIRGEGAHERRRGPRVTDWSIRSARLPHEDRPHRAVNAP